MIVWRAMLTAKRGHVEDVIAWLQKWNDNHGTNSRMKGFRLLRSYVGNNESVINEVEFESVAEWESFYNEMDEVTDFSNLFEITEGFDHDFWVVEQEG